MGKEQRGCINKPADWNYRDSTTRRKTKGNKWRGNAKDLKKKKSIKIETLVLSNVSYCMKILFIHVIKSIGHTTCEICMLFDYN